ncbi:secondary thiamine-phosphate synthase enzyme YjbQ [Paracoccus sediminicola]|uniref:secondary thiamine-phosphate synthase enzyme YjbQ n=1 Tax=Paracoccus sediminicola TaxID=3017783 RepID=UPI0022F0A9E1|nr:secondary thiamine-phosphate synthase enzyme YjbQ [Paracoccus sediminicola]WBU58342.1 secondary thiamine-phosphate synthase enzyme YjbQ [Paracoccus sediminicola]
MIDMVIVDTNGPAMHEITPSLARFVSGQKDGVLTAMIRHTSASLLIQENADPDVQRDLLGWLDRTAPQADTDAMSWITHRSEGPDDMPAHIKAAILPVSLSVPVRAGRLLLGRWQGIYLVEHRTAPHRREVALAFTRA